MVKIVLVGANHAGTAFANTVLTSFKGNELTILDRNTNISYLGCGTALFVGKQIEGTDGLFYNSKEQLEAKGAKVEMEAHVTAIDYEKKTVEYALAGSVKKTVSYDKLVLATGSLPIRPNLSGIDLANIYYAKLFQDGKAIDKALEDEKIKTVAVVGAGYIGVELAEAAKRRGKKVVLFDAESTSVSSYYDKLFSEEMDAHLKAYGIDLQFGQKVQKINGKDGSVCGVVTDKGEFDCEMVIMSIGFTPNTALGKDKLKTFPNGAYLVDLHQATSEADVYAVGDCATVLSNATGKPAYIALATNAVRSGIVAAYNVCGTKLASSGVQGSNAICIHKLNLISTGLCVHAAERSGLSVDYVDYEDFQKPEFIKENGKVKIRIVYEKMSRRIVGAQLSSFEHISGIIHMFSLAIEQKYTIDQLKLLDIFFLPHFNKPYNYITMAALTAK